MKKLFFIICLMVSGMVTQAQVNTTQTINSKLKLTNVPDGLVNDSLLVRGADKVVKKTAVSNLIGDFINDGATTIAPSQNAVFDALQGKVNTSSLTAGRIPYATDTNTLGDSNRLLWDNTSSYLEMNGNNFGLRFKETLNNSYVDIVNGGLGSSTLAFKSNYGSGKTLMTLLNPTGTNAAQLAIGDVTSIPAESQFYVYGGNNGANIDLRGKTTRDETNMDFEGSDWATSPNSLGFSYFGPNYSIGGTVMGYPKVKTGVMRFNNADNALIVSNNGVDVTPIRFGINDEEILNIDNEGLKMIDGKSIYTSSFFLFDGPNGEYGNLQISDNQFFANSYSGFNIFGFSNQSGFNAFFSADGISGNRSYSTPDVDGEILTTGGTDSGTPLNGDIEVTGDNNTYKLFKHNVTEDVNMSLSLQDNFMSMEAHSISDPTASGSVTVSPYNVLSTASQHTLQYLGGIPALQLDGSASLYTSTFLMKEYGAGLSQVVAFNDGGEGYEYDFTNYLGENTIAIAGSSGRIAARTLELNAPSGGTSAHLSVDDDVLEIKNAAGQRVSGVQMGNLAVFGTAGGFSGNLDFTEIATSDKTQKIINANGRIPVIRTSAPSSSTATGVKGEIYVDASYIYYCYDTNLWRRVAGSTF